MSSGKYLDYTYSSNYMALHARVNRDRGPASAHTCARCPDQAHDWAQIHGQDGTDVWADYVPLCRSCHRHYDSVHPTHERETCKYGHRYDEGSYLNRQGVRICRACDRDKTARRRARLVTVS